jgi:hypothetical protein
MTRLSSLMERTGNEREDLVKATEDLFRASQ